PTGVTSSVIKKQASVLQRAERFVKAGREGTEEKSLTDMPARIVPYSVQYVGKEDAPPDDQAPILCCLFACSGPSRLAPAGPAGSSALASKEEKNINGRSANESQSL